MTLTTRRTKQVDGLAWTDLGVNHREVQVWAENRSLDPTMCNIYS